MSKTVAFKFEAPVWFLAGVTAVGTALGAAFPLSIGLMQSPAPKNRACWASIGALTSLAGVIGTSLVVVAAVATEVEEED